MLKKILFCCVLCLFQSALAQDNDSLLKVYKNVKLADTTRLNAFYFLSWNIIPVNPDTGMIMANDMLRYAKKIGYKNELAKAYNVVGFAFCKQKNYKESFRYFSIAASINRSINNKLELMNTYMNIADMYYYSYDYLNSIEYYNRALVIAKEMKNRKDECYFLHNIAFVYNVMPNYPLTLKYYQQALKIAEEIKSVDYMIICYDGLGEVYSAQNNLKMALEYYTKGLEITKKIGGQAGIATSYMQIANVYYFLKNYKQATAYYDRALTIRIALSDNSGIANCYVGFANIYSDQLLNAKALEYYLKATNIKETQPASPGQIVAVVNTGDMYYVLGDYRKALYYSKKGLDSAEKISQLFYTCHANRSVAKAYAKLGNYKEAYEYYVKHKKLNDSIFNLDNSKQIGDLRVNFAVEKRENELAIKSEAEQDKLKAIAQEEKKIQYIILFSVGGILLIVLVFSMFLYKRFTITKRQKQIIEVKSKETEFQKLLVDEKQKEIIDSITYAKRLQHAILPPKDLIDRYLKDNFILYKPKDIIAGDFYWMHIEEKKNGNNFIFIAAADSTGHGVPGAMVSIVCSNALDKSVKEFGLTDTGKILDKTTDLVIETFEKSGEDIKDGMDISLLRIENSDEKTKINWSGANNTLWYIEPRNAANAELTIKEIKADKQPVGKSDHRKPFNSHKVDCLPGTVFYLLTDGFADQFGGPKGKKLKYKQLEELILTNFHKPLNEQYNMLNGAFELWKGELDQVDDVTLIAIKV